MDMKIGQHFFVLKKNAKRIIIEKKILTYVFSFILGAGLIVSSYFLSKQNINFSDLTGYGYIATFVASLFGSATVFFPVPHLHLNQYRLENHSLFVQDFYQNYFQPLWNDTVNSIY